MSRRGLRVRSRRPQNVSSFLVNPRWAGRWCCRTRTPTSGMTRAQFIAVEPRDGPAPQIARSCLMRKVFDEVSPSEIALEYVLGGSGVFRQGVRMELSPAFAQSVS